jgi:tetratricopeptide (TPR) repeat protein
MHLAMFVRALLGAALSTLLIAQEPAIDLTKLRAEANAAVNAGDHVAAAAALRRITTAAPDDGQSWQLLGYSLHLAGRLDEALPAHRRAAEFPRFAGTASYNIACVHALQGRPDEAFVWLDKAVAAGYADVPTLEGDADFASIRADARFAQVKAAMSKKGGDKPLQVFAQSLERKQARASWWGGGKSSGQIAVDWSPVAWRDAFEEQFTSGKYRGKKWRLGADFWTRLDSSFALRFAAVEVPAGNYYLTLEQRDGEQLVLALHDAAAVRTQRIDAFAAQQLQGGIEVAMAHRRGGEAKALAIELEMIDGSKTEGALVIRFGPHQLRAPFVVQLD